MKKFSFLSSVFLLVMVVTFLFIGCQKESAVAEEENTTTTSSADSEQITATVNGSQQIIGLISKDHAEKMSAAFAKKHPSVVTTSVGYSTKNLIAYLSTLLTKYKSDSVFVSFGLYDKETAPKNSYLGRSTIFFLGKQQKSRSGNVRVQSDEDDTKSSNYLNGGEIVPHGN